MALDLIAEGRVSLSWSLDRERFGDEWTWEGPPVVVGGRAYVGLRRCDAVQAQSHVACFDLGSGQPLWRKFVAAASSPRARRSVEWTQHLLTFHGGAIVLSVTGGSGRLFEPGGWGDRVADAISANVDRGGRAERGAISAARSNSMRGTRRDVVVVAAADQPRIFALEATTGRLIWVVRSPGGESTQLLGISDGQVIASGDSLTWLDADGRGTLSFSGAASDLAWRGYGRGLMAGDELWWPTRDAILVFAVVPERTEQGWRPRDPCIDLKNRGASGGNLVLAAGMLFIAGADRLYAFGP